MVMYYLSQKDIPPMMPPLNLKRITLFSGLSAAFFLWLAPFLIVFLTSGVFRALMGEEAGARFLDKAFPFFFLIVAVLGGAGFGWTLARLTKFSAVRALMVAGGVGFGGPFTVTVLVLNMAEAFAVSSANQIPLHVLFALLFNGGMFFTSALHGLAYGLALKNGQAMIRLALASGFGGVLGFGLVNLTLDTLGWRVGAPRAAETATMLLTMMLGNLVGAFGGGAALGYVLAKYGQKNSG